jgi:hypothetical protein
VELERTRKTPELNKRERVRLGEERRRLQVPDRYRYVVAGARRMPAPTIRCRRGQAGGAMGGESGRVKGSDDELA